MKKKVALVLMLFSSFILLQSSNGSIDIFIRLLSDHGLGGY